MTRPRMTTMTTILKRVAVGVLMVAMLVAASPASAQSRTVARVGAFQSQSWTVWVSAGWHQVIVNGDRDTDLDLFVFSPAGALLDVDDDGSDYCVTQFFMPRSGYITIRVDNLGRVYNQYELFVR